MKSFREPRPAIAATYGAGRIKDFLRQRGVRTLSRKTLNFWITLLGLEREPCFEKSSLTRPAYAREGAVLEDTLQHERRVGFVVDLCGRAVPEERMEGGLEPHCPRQHTIREPNVPGLRRPGAVSG